MDQPFDIGTMATLLHTTGAMLVLLILSATLGLLHGRSQFAPSPTGGLQLCKMNAEHCGRFAEPTMLIVLWPPQQHTQSKHACLHHRSLPMVGPSPIATHGWMCRGLSAVVGQFGGSVMATHLHTTGAMLVLPLLSITLAVPQLHTQFVQSDTGMLQLCNK